MAFLLDTHAGISKNAPFPLQWRGIKGEAKQIIRVFRDAHTFIWFINGADHSLKQQLMILKMLNINALSVLQVFGRSPLKQI